MTFKPVDDCLKSVFEFDSIDPSEVDQVMSALIEKKNDYYISQTGKVLIFDEETKRISQTLLNLRAKKQKTGQLPDQSHCSFPALPVI